MSNKIKILFVLPNLIGGGAERVFTYLVNHIDRDKFEPHLALGAKRGAYLQDIKDDIQIYELGGERARSAISPLIRLVWELRPNTVISTLGMNFANLAAKAFYPVGTKVILREGNSVTAFLEDVARNSPGVSTFYRRIYKLLYNRADAIICQSDFMLRDIADNLDVGEENLYRIHNPVDFNKVDSLLKQNGENLFSDDKELFNFVSVGKLHYHKGYDILLPAFAKAKQQNPNIRLTILGEGDEREPLEKLRQELGLEESVAMPGFVKNPYIYIEAADAFVSSSRYEGFANVIVESLACRTPVVATDCPSANREVIREGENGWFAKVEDVESLAETLLRAAEEARDIDGEEIRENCKERFSIERILPFYESYLSLN